MTRLLQLCVSAVVLAFAFGFVVYFVKHPDVVGHALGAVIGAGAAVAEGVATLVSSISHQLG